MSELWICPKCKAPLLRDAAKQDRAWVCKQGHTYDVARQGYTNLLLANRKNSREPGDSEVMIAARKGFLDLGYYAPLVETIAAILQQLIQEVLPETLPKESPGQLANLSPEKLQAEAAVDASASVFRLLDLGCGEGYYLRSLQPYLTALASQFLGVDISKPAVKKAASADKCTQYAVASCYDIPISDHSVHAALSVFSPVCPEETQRVLVVNGMLVRVAPGANHLAEIKQRIYENYKTHEAPNLIENFDLVEERRVQNVIALTQQSHIENLLSMTPFFWHGNPEAKEQLLSLDELSVTTDFVVQVFRAQERVIVEEVQVNDLHVNDLNEGQPQVEVLPSKIFQPQKNRPLKENVSSESLLSERPVPEILMSDKMPTQKTSDKKASAKSKNHKKAMPEEDADPITSEGVDSSDEKPVAPKNQNIWKR